jgi:hypothetical protein
MGSTGAAGKEEKELVIVEWRDIIATSGWEQDISCPTLFSVGWLIRVDDDTVVIANTLDPDDFTGEGQSVLPVPYGLHAFPSGAVVRIRRILSEAYPPTSQKPLPM